MKTSELVIDLAAQVAGIRDRNPLTVSFRELHPLKRATAMILRQRYDLPLMRIGLALGYYDHQQVCRWVNARYVPPEVKEIMRKIEVVLDERGL